MRYVLQVFLFFQTLTNARQVRTNVPVIQHASMLLATTDATVNLSTKSKKFHRIRKLTKALVTVRVDIRLEHKFLLRVIHVFTNVIIILNNLPFLTEVVKLQRGKSVGASPFC